MAVNYLALRLGLREEPYKIGKIGPVWLGQNRPKPMDH
jgi:hypothetical protein